MSHGSKRTCLDAIESAKICSKKPECFDKQTAPTGKFYFLLKTITGQNIATSQMFGLEASRDRSITAVISNGPRAELAKEKDEY